VGRGTRWEGTTQCHGLAGNIEFLLDMFQETRDSAYLDDANALGYLLQTFGVEREGRLVWPSESASTFTPDYMVGYAGVAMTFLRLSAPDRLPHQLSTRCFRRTAVCCG
jgi:lantibiotic modifying enzyme